MWPLTSTRAKRISGPKKLSSTRRKGLFQQYLHRADTAANTDVAGWQIAHSGLQFLRSLKALLPADPTKNNSSQPMCGSVSNVDPGSTCAPTRSGRSAGKLRNIPADGIDGLAFARLGFL